MMRKRLSALLLVLILLVGSGLLLYPTVSDHWNALHQSRAIAGYVQTIADADHAQCQQLLRAAAAYNKSLLPGRPDFLLSPEELEEYHRTLDLDGTGIMGYIEIGAIGCSLPIYHGTDDAVLQVAVGHLPGSSLPVGGKGTHCVLSGHRGLPSAKIFTDLDRLAEGDTFVIRTLDEILTYEVDQFRIVLPSEVSDLAIEEEEDLCTLVTCTPYGVNSHRLLVRGHRASNRAVSSIRVSADALVLDGTLTAPLFAVPAALAGLVWLTVHTEGKRKTNQIRNKLGLGSR